MKYEWNIEKAQKNQESRGVDFSMIHDFNWDAAVILVDDRHDYNEVRYVALGLIEDRVYNCVFTDRRNKRRIISLRKANKRESIFYERERDA